MITGYTATNIVQVTLDDLSQVGKVIDSATRSGANVVQNLQYGLKNQRTVRGEALRTAAEDARTSLDSIALGLGMRVVRVLSAEEITSEEQDFGMKKKVPPPQPEGTEPATRLEVGMIEVTATVVVRAEIGQ